ERLNKKDSVDTFFQDPSDQRSTKFIEKLRESEIIRNESNKTHHEEDKVESELQNSFSAPNDNDSEYIPSDTDESTSDELIEDNDDLDCNDPPKIDKVAFRKTHDAIPDITKLKLSTGKIVEDILFNFCKDMDYEQMERINKDRIGVPIISHDIIKDLRTITMKSFLEEEKYDIRKHYDNEWIQLAIRTLANLYENMASPLIRTQYEHWFTVTLLGTSIDFCLWDIRLGTDIKRIDAPSSSSVNRKNRNRKANTRKRKLVGRKIDGIIYTTDELLEFGAIEGARSFKGVSDNKYLNEEFKIPKTLRGMYSDLIRAVNYDDQRANKLQVIGILHLGLWIQFVRLWRAGGSICIFRKDPQSFNIHSKFSKKGLRSFLKFLVRIYQYKNNLQVLDILNDDDNNDDLLKELNEQCSTPPPASIQFFADCENTPKKKRTNSKEKNPRQKKIKSNHP
ncbi:1076_t:CDS:2, partial [Ambispora gerdemannii]